MVWSQYFVADNAFEIYKNVFDIFEVWDAHTHIGKDIDGNKLSASQLIKIMNKSHVNRAVIFPFNDPDKKKNFHKPNQVIYNAYKRHPKQLIPFFRLNPHWKWEKEFSLRLDQGFKGIKLHPRAQHFDLTYDRVIKIYEKAEENSLAILIHTGMGIENTAKKLEKITKTFPNLKIILGHSAFVDINEAINRLKKFKNIYFDTSTIKIFDLYDLLNTVPASRIVYGSDMPYLDMEYSVEAIIHTCIILNISLKNMERIFNKNLSSILGM